MGCLRLTEGFQGIFVLNYDTVPRSTDHQHNLSQLDSEAEETEHC